MRTQEKIAEYIARGKVMSWENEVLRHGFADWSDDDPVPTQRNPQPNP